MNRWLVTGAHGQLGSDLCRVLGEQDRGAVVGLGRDALDVTDPRAVAAALAEHRPDVVLNAAAWTDVDGAEASPEAAWAVNAVGPAHLARACAARGTVLVHVSTDYVFAGNATTPYAEDAAPGPRSAYGRSKLAGEQAVAAAGGRAYVVRTAWVYGQTGRSFVKTMAQLERQRDTVSVVDDQCGSPTWARHLAGALVTLAGSGAAYGTYHVTNGGQTTWYGLARAVFEELGADPERVRPTTTAAFPRPAPRPSYSVLGAARWTAAGLPDLPHWRVALHEAFTRCPEALRGADGTPGTA